MKVWEPFQYRTDVLFSLCADDFSTLSKLLGRWAGDFFIQPWKDSLTTQIVREGRVTERVKQDDDDDDDGGVWHRVVIQPLAGGVRLLSPEPAHMAQK